MDIIISTDGTVANTKLSVDGKEITKNNKVVSIQLYASSPFKSQYSGETYKGGVSVGYETVDEKGIIERKTLGTTETNYVNGIGQKIKSNDQIVQHIGSSVDVEISNLVDKIVKHCEDNKINCATKEDLSVRTKQSLLDKISDLNIKLEG